MFYLYRTEDGETVEAAMPAFAPEPELTLPDGRIAKRLFTVPRITHHGTGWGTPDDGDPQADWQRLHLEDNSRVGPDGKRY